ncbi:hypothetical protein T492DRAFT_861554 [Pavlovales sp. CCMP2436]|nr:hypothetical protein T492DRAFT_861554 [Pavlovales sp. CCMP2436]
MAAAGIALIRGMKRGGLGGLGGGGKLSAPGGRSPGYGILRLACRIPGAPGGRRCLSSGDGGAGDGSELDDFVGIYRGASLRSRAPGRFAGNFRSRDAASSYHGPIARFSSAQPRGGDPKPVLAEYESSLRMLYAGANGCLGAHLLWDQEKNEVTSFTVWESSGHLRALTETDPYGTTMSRFGTLLVGVPEVRTLRVLASVTRDPAPATPTSEDGDAAAGAT